ncbi:MAG TPA: cyanophycin synthetase, partial [Polyangiaceae bacterium]|nr:cyanophycin synthetase [Polyangiaceae bacterium]
DPGRCRLAVINTDDPSGARLAAETATPVRPYGWADAADLVVGPVASRFRWRGQPVVLPIGGAHNVLNALAAVAVADELEVPLDVTREAIASFHGVQRRFTVVGRPTYEKRGKRGEVMIVDDYGHHPAEIEATLDAAQRGFDRRVVVAFQPHRYTRTKLLFDEFTRAFNKADALLVTDVYPAGEAPIEGATGEALADAIRAHGHRAVSYIAGKDRVARALFELVEPGDIVIALGAGDINASARELLALIERTRSP